MTSKVVFITGANQGIGFAIAQGLSAEHPDYRILVGSRDAQRGFEAARSITSATAIQIDVTDDASIETAKENVEAEYGRIDVLVNNAGISIEDRSAIKQLSTRQVFETTFNTNVFGATVVTEAFLPLLLKSNDPRLIFVSSGLGSLELTASNHPSSGPNLQVPAYKSSKAALNMVMLTYAKRLQDTHVKVNAISPGFVTTNLTGYTGFGTAADGARHIIDLIHQEHGDHGAFIGEEGTICW